MFNKVILMGRLVADPELRQTPSNISVCRFRIAVDRGYTSNSGERQADFISIVAWRQQAEFVSKYLVKGRMATVSGRLQIREWTDKDGNKRTLTDIIAEEAYFVESKATAEANAYKDSATHPYDVAGKPIPAPVNPVSPPPYFEEIKTDDDLPF